MNVQRIRLDPEIPWHIVVLKIPKVNKVAINSLIFRQAVKLIEMEVRGYSPQFLKDIFRDLAAKHLVLSSFYKIYSSLQCFD